MRALFIFLACCLWSVQLANASPFTFGQKQQDFLPVDEAFTLHVEQPDAGGVVLRWDIAPGYYLYQERLRFAGLPPGIEPQLPPGEAYHDEYFGDSRIYRDSLEVQLPDADLASLELGWQGCADAGLCYPPQSRTVELGGSSTPPSMPVQADDQALASGLQQQSLGWSLLIFFGLGLLLAFAPCSLPMLPILAGIVVGSQAGPRRGMALAGAYVFSMALVYAALGVVAALLGANLQGWLMQPWLIASFAGLFVLLSLPMFGFFELQLPAGLRDRLEQAGRQRRGGSLAGASALGVLSGLLVGPCMTAPLAAALLYIAQSGDALNGGLVLFALGLGIGTPLVLLVTVGNRFLPKPGPWMDRVKVSFGFLFLVAALYVLRPLLSDPLWVGLWGALLVVGASGLLHLSRELVRHQALSRAVASLAGIWGVALLLGAAGGAQDVLRPLGVFTGSVASSQGAEPAHGFVGFSEPADLDRELAAARAAGQWVLVDYYADWCVSCKVMEKEVFGDAQVQAALTGVRILRPDVTQTDPASRELLNRYQVMGPPTLLFIGPDGEERRTQRITGEVDANQFLNRWNQTMERG
ncbi:MULTISPECIES: protein-disulfide reductase DsbD [Pseudomonadaceae]|jgi:thiol:disulfide interchange protein DsbD|uniref:Thiol:disulfide interchange protein DsbD n=6 Tax=Pseudomonadota TaxID=1224 RepID=A0A6I6LNB6_STUST|nr:MULTISPECIES: protein-disulfide reductase DsbD [Pseudomonadaceae]KJS80516.2 MAG: thiol:disulfide interchange protein [[Pseudomonas] sp. BICA1-14]MBG5402723.1 protein-disulfide reductase DsbD [Pseudomonas aeruginosa]MBH4353251.1 protein-disulfide reductase DsbD [Pseudomonas aeruginosa]MCS8144911.1 protein-disulfide reductase DsbD [Pseudomonas aeruginosa]MDH0121137.1 protein-disulfide reductase DsbD [Stutzerimonas stutzeri]